MRHRGNAVMSMIVMGAMWLTGMRLSHRGCKQNRGRQKSGRCQSRDVTCQSHCFDYTRICGQT